MGRQIITILFIIIFNWGNVAWAATVPPQVDAEAAVLMRANTKQVLFGKNPNGIMYPASTTKIMTLITALEQGDLKSIMTVSPSAAACEGSSLDLIAGRKLLLKNALYGMMLISGNDAAEAIAEHVADSIPLFAGMMNANAEKIGALSTNFSNPHGLPDPYNHYTTAYDLALITAYGMQNTDFVKIVGTRSYDVDFIQGPSIHVNNTNKLLATYPGANGGKTGYTNDAGECLVATAKRGNIQLIAVILNSETRWDDAKKLLDYGFDQAGL